MSYARRIRVVMLLVVFILAVLPAAAQAAWPQFGISQSFRNFGLKAEQGPFDFSEDVSRSQFWAPLDIERLRVIVPFDLAFRNPSDGRRQEFQLWLDRANELGAEPYVVFGPTELTTNVVDAAIYPGEVFRTPSTDQKAPNELVAPLVATYRTAIDKFMATWGPGTLGNVRLFGAWNEPNVEEVSQVLPGGAGSARVYLPANSQGGYSTERSMGHPKENEEPFYAQIKNCPSGQTWTVYNCGPKMAAYYWYNATQEIIERAAQCSAAGGCRVVAGEFASRPKHLWYWDKYVGQIDAISSLRPGTISFHGHNDAKPLTGNSEDCIVGQLSKCITTTFDDWLETKPYPWNDRSAISIWDTEVGAEHASGTSPSSPDTAQNNRFLHMLSVSEANHVERLYYFNFAGTGVDRGLIDPEPTLSSRARTVWSTIKSRPGVSPQNLFNLILGPRDFNGDGKGDLLGRNAAGNLYRYAGNGSGGFAGGGQLVGTGWNVFTQMVAPGDFSGDGKSDLLGLAGDGNLYLYPGSGTGGTGGGQLIGTGWGMFDAIVTPGDFSGDGKADLLGRTPDGTLYLYRGNGAGGFSGGGQWLGTGWNMFKTILGLGDFSGDGKADVLGLTPAGELFFYPGNGAGGFSGGGQWLGTGWNMFNALVAPGDFSGDGKVDLIGRKPDGTLYLYRGNGAGAFSGGAELIEVGW